MSFKYQNSNGYQYMKIDPKAYKFTAHPAFARPPTPPILKPPKAQPFVDDEASGTEEKGEEAAPESAGDEEGQDVGPDGSADGASEEPGKCSLDGLLSLSH